MHNNARMVAVVCLALFAACKSPTPAPMASAPTQSILERSHPGSLTEPEYTQLIAAQYHWQAEVITSIGTRCDLVSSQYAIEVERPSKCYESIGQCGHYAVELHKQPAVLFLLSENASSERRFVDARIRAVCERWGITILWYDITKKTIVE